jgi:LuxR family maltose regulon positive regulatory protein
VGLLRSAFGHRDISAAIADAARTARLESDIAAEFRHIALANLGVLLYLSGDLERARRVLRQVNLDPQAPRRPYAFIMALATAALMTLDEGDADTGAREAQRAVEFAASVGLADNPVAALAQVARGRALDAAHQPVAAREHLDRAVDMLRGSVLPAWHVSALLWAAPMRQRIGNSAGAYALVDEAETLLTSFADAGALTGRLADVKQRLELDRRRRAQSDSGGLTEAELGVLRQLRDPKSQREIATDMSVSLNTVKTHCRSIFRKLDVTSREQAVSRAAERGIL